MSDRVGADCCDELLKQRLGWVACLRGRSCRFRRAAGQLAPATITGRKDRVMKITVHDSKSPLGFATKGGGSWEIWDRFITIEGKDAYHIGNICGTCSFFFQRCDGANQSLNPRDLQDQLTTGLTGLTDAQATALSELLPDGDYEATLLHRIPRLVTPGDTDDYFCREQPALWGNDGFGGGLPHNPRTKYYRGADKPLGHGAHLYEEWRHLSLRRPAVIRWRSGPSTTSEGSRRTSVRGQGALPVRRTAGH